MNFVLASLAIVFWFHVIVDGIHGATALNSRNNNSMPRSNISGDLIGATKPKRDGHVPITLNVNAGAFIPLVVDWGAPGNGKGEIINLTAPPPEADEKHPNTPPTGRKDGEAPTTGTTTTISPTPKVCYVPGNFPIPGKPNYFIQCKYVPSAGRYEESEVLCSGGTMLKARLGLATYLLIFYTFNSK